MIFIKIEYDVDLDKTNIRKTICYQMYNKKK